jgi:hypothetical protein
MASLKKYVGDLGSGIDAVTPGAEISLGYSGRWVTEVAVKAAGAGGRSTGTREFPGLYGFGNS